MNHKSDYMVYDKYAEEIEKEIMFSRVIQKLEIDEVKGIDIFPSIDKFIILYIVDALGNKLEDYDEYGKLLRLRKTKHFYESYKYVYEGLYNCVKIFEFRKNTPSIPIELPGDMVKSYSDKYYLMDLYYRKFYIAFDKNSSSGTLQKLRDMVEGQYINWFMMDLSYSWSESIASNLNNRWDIQGTIEQKDFYNKYIEPIVYDKRKVFVIISDALRYEVAAELCDRLDAESLGSVELTSLISGLPSTTKYGMARLLPHESIELKENGFIYVDKINSGSMEGRKQILLSHSTESTAISYKTFLTMSTSEISEFYKGRSFADSFDKYFKLGTNLNQRDVIGVRKTVSGLVKLIYPNGEYEKEDIEEILIFALEGRRRVKEQLKKIGGMEFYDVHFSYIDKETLDEEFVSVPEQGGGKLIPSGMGKPGHVYTIGHGDSGMIGVYKLENQVVSGTGKFDKSGIGGHRGAKESLDTAFRYFTANSKSISSSIGTKTKDFLMHIADLQGIGMTSELGTTRFNCKDPNHILFRSY